MLARAPDDGEFAMSLLVWNVAQRCITYFCAPLSVRCPTAPTPALKDEPPARMTPGQTASGCPEPLESRQWKELVEMESSGSSLLVVRA